REGDEGSPADDARTQQSTTKTSTTHRVGGEMPVDLPIDVEGPFVGVDKTREARELAPNVAFDALNVNLDGGTLRAALGYDSGAVAPNNSPIEKGHDFRRRDGTKVHLVKAGPQLYSVDGTTFTEIGGAVLSSGNLAQYLTLNDRVYIVHGGVPKVTDGTSLFDWLIARPTFATDLATFGAEGTGKLNGEYDYKITFYSSTWGQESPSSPSTDQTDTAAGLEKTTTVSPVNQWVTLSNFDTTSDTRVDKYRIYRRKTSNFEADWRFIDEIDSTTTSYTDRVPDNNVSLTSIAPLTFEAEFPHARFIAYNAGVIFVAGIDTEPTAIYFTPTNKTVLGQFDVVEDTVTGLIAFQGQMVVFTESAIWIFSGNTAETLFKRKAIADRGCLAPFSIRPIDNVIFFLSENGFYSYDLSRVVEVSRPVKDILLARNFSRDYNMDSVHDWQNSAVWWIYSSGTSTENDKIIVHFYRNSALVKQPSWVPWSIPGLESATLITNPTTNLREIKLGFNTGRVTTYGGGSDFNGTDIEFLWETGKQDGRAPYINKRWGLLAIDSVRKAASGEMNVHVSLNDSDIFELAGEPYDLENEMFSTRLARRAAQLRTRFSASLSGELEIVKWRYEIEAGARRRR
ncbi:MAG: hypothetical protein ABFS46_08845, partial [Myxococcota bacterium]